MNQEQNNLNPNNFNTQSNNGIPNNQPLNNQSFNNTFNQNVVPNTNLNQSIVQPPQQPMNTGNINNQNLNSNPPNKTNIGLIIGIVVAVLVAIVSVIIAIICVTNNVNKNDIDKDHNDSIENNNQENNNSNSIGTIDKNTNTTYDENGAFLLRVEDVFTITGRGTVVTGTVERGTIKMNDEVQIIGLDKEIITTIVTGLEAFRSNLDYATVGDNVGILLRGVEREQVQAGQVIAKPNSILAIKKFDADLSVISTEDGGRGTPFFEGFSPQFYFRTDIKGKIDLPEGKEIVNPGEDVSVTVSLTTSIAMDVGTKFSIREGGRTIATGVVTKVY